MVSLTQRLTFLGIDIDCSDQTLALPEPRLSELKDLLQLWPQKHKVTKGELQHLVGKLNWAAKVIKGGRTFLRRIIDIMCTLKSKHHRVRLNASARADIAW